MCTPQQIRSRTSDHVEGVKKDEGAPVVETPTAVETPTGSRTPAEAVVGDQKEKESLGCAQIDPHNLSETSVIALEIKLFL